LGCRLLFASYDDEICGKLKALVGKRGFVKFLSSDNISFGVSDAASNGNKDGNGFENHLNGIFF